MTFGVLPIPTAGILLCLFVITTLTTATQNVTRSVCTSPYTVHTTAGWLRLTCPEGGLIYVVRAVYGRSSSRLCAFTEGDTCLSNSLYSAPIVACLGRSSCSIPARPVHLSRCGEDSDYLHVEYQCIAGDASSRFDICGGRPSAGSGVPLVKEGHIMTTNFPSPYPRRALCDCLITAAISAHTRIELELLDFRLESSPGCTYDFVEVVRGDAGGGAGRGADRMCGGIRRWARRSVNSTWVRLRLSTDDDNEFRGFWIRVWALTLEDTLVPVTVTCQGHLPPLVPTTTLPSPGVYDQNIPGPSGAPPGVSTTSDGRRIWLGTLPPEDSTVRTVGRQTTQTASKNTGIIIGVCVAGLVTMVIINIVGIIICRRNMQANRSKRAAAECPRGAPDPGADSSLSSLDTEYVSLNAHGATYRGADLYSTPPDVILPDDGVTIERTPGVGQSSIKPSNYDYGMLPETYTRKAHTIAGGEHVEAEDPYAILRDHARNCDVQPASARQSFRRAVALRSSKTDYEDIDEYPTAAPLPPGGSFRASGRSVGSRVGVTVGISVGDRGKCGRASVHSRLSVLTHNSDVDPDRGHSEPRSPGSGSSGRTSSFSVEEVAPPENICHAQRSDDLYHGTCGGVPHEGGSTCMSCQDGHKVVDISMEGAYPLHDHSDPHDMVEYANSETSTTRSEYL